MEGLLAFRVPHRSVIKS